MSVLAVGYTGFSTIIVGGCGDACDYALIGMAVQGNLWFAVAAFLGSLAVVALRARRRNPSWWAPAGATASVILVSVVAMVAIRSAVP